MPTCGRGTKLPPLGLFTCTSPKLSSSVTLAMTRESCEKRYETRPYSVSFALLITSSRSLKLYTGRMGPKTSSWQRRVLSGTLSNKVGMMYDPLVKFSGILPPYTSLAPLLVASLIRSSNRSRAALLICGPIISPNSLPQPTFTFSMLTRNRLTNSSCTLLWT